MKTVRARGVARSTKLAHDMKAFNDLSFLTRRALVGAALCCLSHPRTSFAELSGNDGESLAKQYAAGVRASGGRGANTMLKKRADSGVQRIGGSPLFKSGEILDTLRSDDGSAVDISFSFPSDWSVSSGPNLDVRNLRTSDSAFLLVAPLPEGKTIEQLPRQFYTNLIFSREGKYGAYGGVDDFSVRDFEMVNIRSPSGGEQPYRRFSLTFAALTYNANTVQRRARVSATALRGSVFVLVAGCLGTRYTEASRDLTDIQDSYRAYTTSKARVEQIEVVSADGKDGI